MNNKGMAISSILYTILVLFLVLIFGILGLISSAKTTFDTLKYRLSVNINDTKPHVIAVEDDFIDNKIIVTVTSRKYINSYYISQSDDEITKEEFNSNINKHDLEYPTGSFTTNYIKENNNEYYIYLKDIHDNVYKYPIVLKQITIGTVYNFDYTGSVQEFTTPCDGDYEVELWGAQGGSGTTTAKVGGKGAYTSGMISLSKDTKFYLYVGGEGPHNAAQTNVGGYNGGGYSGNNSSSRSFGGGGATDVRYFTTTPTAVGLAWNSFDGLKARIMVAAGGGGNVSTTNYQTTAGGGGGLIGIAAEGNYSATIPTGGTQTGPGAASSTDKKGRFGTAIQSNVTGWGGGGGSGYWGGSMGHGHAGSGGSSFISGYEGCIAIDPSSTSSSVQVKTGCSTITDNNRLSCSIHYSELYFTDAQMIDAKGCDWATGTAANCGENQPQPDGTTAIGHSGNGYARITLAYTSDSTTGLQYKISSNDLDSKSRITVGANESKTITITLKSLNLGNTKYELYYRASNRSGVSVVSSDSVIDTIGENESKTIKVTINNNGSESVIIKFLAAGSTTKQSPTIDGQHIRILDDVYICDYGPGKTWDFAYTGDHQEFSVPCNGTYKIELWGAQGGSGTTTAKVGGKGAYTSGMISLSEDTKFYLYVGGEGPHKAAQTNVGGYNGGGYSGKNSGSQSFGGGGATDVRYFTTTPTAADLAWDSFDGLKARIMVAAGGGGNVSTTTYQTTAGGGGGLIGIAAAGNSSYTIPTGGTKTGPGEASSSAKKGKFGYAIQSNVTIWGGGGGSGYWGGSMGNGHAGSGGSSFISGYEGCIAIDPSSTSSSVQVKTGCSTITDNNRLSCSIHYSELYFTDAQMIDAKGCDWATGTAANCGENQPQPDGTTAIGHSGNGYAKITYIGN